MPKDRGVVTRNIKRLLNAGAPDTDIDQYLIEEGYNPETFIQEHKQIKTEAKPFTESAKKGVSAAVSSMTGFLPSPIAASPIVDAAMSPEGQRMGRRVVPSALELGKGVVSAVVHPIRTAKGIKSLIAGTYSKVTGGDSPDEKTVDALANFYKNRYGTFEKVGETMVEDPAGFATDLSAVLGLGGATLKGVGTVGKIGSLAKAGKTLSKASRVVDPFLATTKGISGIAGKIKKMAAGAGITESKAFVQALKPRHVKEFNKSLKIALPEIKKTIKEVGKDVDSLDDLADITQIAQKKIWAKYAKLLKRGESSTIDGNVVADAMIGNVSQKVRDFNPTLFSKIKKHADKYRKNIDVNLAEDYLQSTNGELLSYYAKNKISKEIAKRNPSVAYKIKEAEALRKELYAKLDEVTGKNTANLKRMYGALDEIETNAMKRAEQFARTTPSFTESGIMGLLRGWKTGGTLLSGTASVALNKLTELTKDPNFVISAILKGQKIPKKPSILGRIPLATYQAGKISKEGASR